MSVYSFSQLQVYHQCPRKYQYKHIDKIKETEFESSPDLILGQAVHKALENLYNQINIFVTPTNEDVVRDFHMIWDQELAKATKEKPLNMKGTNTLEDYLRRGDHYLKAYYEKHHPFQSTKIIATESMMTFDLDEKGEKKFRWVVDRIDKEGDSFVINDYKTNKNLPPEAKQEYIEQLTLYGLGIRQNYGKYFNTLKARLHYLHFDLEDEREITQERLDAVTQKYAEMITAIEDKRFHYNMGDSKAFSPQENSFCKYCEFMSICPLRAHLKFDDEVVAGELGEKTIKGLVDEYVQFSKQESEAKGQKEAIKEILIAYLEKKNLLKLFGNICKISASQTENLSIKDKDALFAKLQEIGIVNEVLEIDRFKLQKLVKDGKIDPNKLGSTIEKKVSWTLRGSQHSN